MKQNIIGYTMVILLADYVADAVHGNVCASSVLLVQSEAVISITPKQGERP